jgi:type IV pilus assembly protein PilA
MRRNLQQGFTLIELMIVIAIVAILVALAVPAYKDYTIRAKVTECVNGAAVAKLQISEFRETVGYYPPGELEAGTGSPAAESQVCIGFDYRAEGGGVGSVGTGNFQIIVNAIEIDATLTGGAIEPELVPNDSAQGGVNWDCINGDTVDEYVKYLPSTCRADST